MSVKLDMEPWQVADAVQLLIENYRGNYPDEKIRHYTLFEKHPFDLPIPISQRAGSRYIRLLECPGHTEPSVNAMAAVLGAQLRFVGREPLQELYLRIIECHKRTLGDGREHCDLYFEVGGLTNIFIVGGTNNYSGAGGAGGITLERLFAFTAAIFGRPIQRVRIAQPFAERRQERILAVYNANCVRE